MRLADSSWTKAVWYRDPLDRYKMIFSKHLTIFDDAVLCPRFEPATCHLPQVPRRLARGVRAAERVGPCGAGAGGAGPVPVRLRGPQRDLPRGRGGAQHVVVARRPEARAKRGAADAPPSSMRGL